ncbi:hypothetical protein ASPWEDRAFT_42551 [Aspergillus wentii DTO 134E9]|uniref:Uncharacterized protein n=1 Tax=Aspergillus wentii DTO 134E9 TaxID=1073089 RepID=A0A1L9RI16_ASPWE|nr:uncharacterized protein ASPWEDRAFT_42551 [Aspergillus wentii DTO 134E9]OJJ34564.1 hypothetical protein ASPWEDRAFT_42551 [Aspergillus wentii DTO 134E9]
MIFVVAECIGQLKWVWFQKKRQLQGIQNVDDASRGPWGSLTILFQRPGRSLISLGAIVTILALAFEPFMQQIVTYPTRQVESPSKRAIAKQSHIAMPVVDDGFRDSVDSGIWGKDFNVNPTCPSGNCTWAPFTSIGYCSRCEDITSQPKSISCPNVTMDHNMTGIQKTMCNITILDGPWIQTPIQVKPLGDGALVMEIPEDVIWQADIWGRPLSSGQDWTRKYPYKNEMTSLAHARLNVTTNKKRPQKHPECALEILNVTRCILSLCTREYNISVSEGIPSMNISQPNWGKIFTYNHTPGGSWYQNETVCWQPGQGATVNVTQLPGGNTWDRISFANAREFAVCPNTLYYNEIGGGLKGYSTQDWFVRGKSDTEWTFLSSADASTDNIDKILRMGLGTVTKNVAASMTKYVLENNSTDVAGTVAVSESYVAVDWRWLTLPLLLLLCSIALLISTIWINMKRKLGIWKSSILPMLYHGLEDGMVPDSDDLATVSGMNQAAGKVDARLSFSDKKGRLMLRDDV